jgi:hypothetical protein
MPRINGVLVSKDEYDIIKSQQAKQAANNVDRLSRLAFLADGLSAIAPSNPQVLDTNANVKNVASRPADAFTNRDRQSVEQNPNLLYGSGGPTTQPANGGIDARLATYGLTLNARPNPLSDYANYTYHIRWFMTSEFEAYNRVDERNPNSSNLAKTVIAESGVTAGFNIVELITKQSGGADLKKRNMWAATEFEMTVSEPLGLSLFDKIYFASQNIHTINHMLCPYFIEIWFTGYDEDGNIAADQLFYNMYRVIFRDCEATTTQVGTTYHIKFNVDNSVSETNQIATPQAGLNITCVTLGDFFDQFETSLNGQQPQLNNDGVHRITYKFDYPSAWRTWNIRPADTDKHVSRNSEMDAHSNFFGLGKGTVIKVNKGQAIESVINFVVYLCQEAQDWITGASVPGGGNQTDHGIIGYVSVYGSTKITGFDPTTRDYTREITYTLFRTESTKSYVDMQSALEAQKPTTQEAKLRYLVQNNRLAKRYDYIYTGLNTEVITFDFKMNMTWAFAQPTWNQGNSYGQYATPALVNPPSFDNQRAKNVLATDKVGAVSSQAAILDQSPTNLGDLAAGTQTAASRQSIEQAIANGQINPTRSIPGNLSPAPTTSSPSPRDNVIFFNQSNGQLALTANQQKNAAYRQLEAGVNNYIDSRTASKATAYVEDTNINTDILNNPPLPLVAIFDPKPSLQNAQQNSDQTKTPPDNNAQAFAKGTGFVGAIFGNIFSDGTKEFQTIELGIRGDPWWMAQSNIKLNSLALQLTNNTNGSTPTTNSQEQQASFLGGDNCFLLEMRVGVVIDEETGLAKSNNQGADFFTGIYMVTDVTNMFRDGKFTQTLKARKDILAQNPISTTKEGDKSTAGTAPVDPLQAGTYAFGA